MLRFALASIAAAVLAGCGLFSDPPRRIPATLTEFKPVLQTRVLWSTSVGSGKSATLSPAIIDGAVVATSANGEVSRFDGATGKVAWRSSLDMTVSAGIGVGEGLVIVGSPGGDVAALSMADGKTLWKVRLPGEMYGVPVAARGIVVVRSSDARLFAMDARTGARLWTLQRPLPALVLRARAGMAISGDLLIASFPGGRLLGIALQTGTVRYDVSVAVPRGTTELERIADVIGTPVLEGQDACVVAFQGKIGCMNATTGAQAWARDFSSSVGVAADSRYVFGIDERSVVQAMVRSSGVTMWTNDKLKDRELSAPASIGRSVVVGDFQGYVHFLSREEGVFLARVATDGSPIEVAPRMLERDGQSIVVVQTGAGGLYAIGAQ